MSIAWHEIRDHLMQTSNTLGFQRGFEVVRRGRESLCGFPDPSALLDALHGAVLGPEDKNRILRALIGHAQTSRRAADCASTLLLLALWPGLDAIHGRLRRYYRAELDALASDVISHALEQIARCDRTRVNWIAATLLRNTERDIRRMLQAQAKRLAAHKPFQDDAAGVQVHDVLACDPARLDPVVEAARLTSVLEPILARDASLVISISVLGYSQREAAERLGCSYAAVRKRYQRAVSRLSQFRDADGFSLPEALRNARGAV